MSAARIPAETDVLVVGAGPAGLAAAEAAAGAGASVVVLDEYALPGGQYYRQSRLKGRLPERIIGPSQDMGRRQLSRLPTDRVQVFCGTLVWSTFGGASVDYVRGNASGRITARAIVLATGAHERVVPFPGWDLPGVMTAGSAQTLLKEQAILPGRSVVISGTGPFLFPVATQLLNAGARVPHILEANDDFFWLLRSPRLYRQVDKYREALFYLRQMLRHRAKVQTGKAVVAARGDGRVEEVDIARLSSDWTEVPGSRVTVRTDAVLVNHGFLPNIQLPRLFGCELDWNKTQSSYVVRRGPDQRSSLRAVFVAGEVTGFGGHRVAQGEGEVAGTFAAAEAGAIDRATAERRVAPARRRLALDQAFADHVNGTFRVRPALYGAIADDTIVCRCEVVTAGEVRHQARLWEGALRPIKQCTRAGMGQCQGRMCQAAVAIIAADASNRPVTDLGLDSVRPSVKPVDLAALVVSGA